MASTVEGLAEQRLALLDAWRATQREIATLQAKSAALLAERCELMSEEIAQAPLHRDAIERSMVAEYSAAGHISRGSIEYAFTDARMLHDEFSLLRESHETGRVTAAHVREVIRESDAVREAVASGAVAADTLVLYQAAVLEVAETDTPARTRAHARQVAAALAGETVTERHERAASERTVTVRSVGDGLALLQAVLPEYLALAILDRLTAMARHVSRHPDDRSPVLPPLNPEEFGFYPEDDREPPEAAEDPEGVDAADAAIFSTSTFATDPFTDDPFADAMSIDENDPYIQDLLREVPDRPLPLDPMFHDDSPCIIHLPGDSRTIDQIRADLFTDLLLAADPGAVHGASLENIRATVQVTVAATTLTGQDDRPAELDGHGPLHPDAARTLAGNHTGWTRLFLDPTGMVTETDTYTPTAGMRRFLTARDQHCRFPGCRQPLHRCDLDHTQDWALGGKTSLDNLAHLCKTHHVLKHPDIPDAHRWTARQLPDWTLEWSSPDGNRHADRPPRRVMFVPSGPPDPGGPPDPADREQFDAPQHSDGIWTPAGSPPPRPARSGQRASVFSTEGPTAAAVGSPF